jgi:hypothetical protein
MNTDTIVLDEFDVAVLFAIPHPGADLLTILNCYIFIHRDACPSFNEIGASLQKSQEAGIVIRIKDRYRVTEEWYDRIHRHDDSAGNEIESLLIFQDEVLGEPLGRQVTSVKPLTMEEYENAVSQLIMR